MGNIGFQEILIILIFVGVIFGIVKLIITVNKTKSTNNNMFCSNCGQQIDDSSSFCPKCGAAKNNTTQSTTNMDNPYDVERFDWLTTVLLCFFLGGLGIHSFYTKKTGIGVFQLLTLGGCGIWALIDFITILTGSFTDGNGNTLHKK
jgi:predicted RNA-binding Zn-ribbon protein involved in translation (DUF1610 family)